MFLKLWTDSSKQMTGRCSRVVNLTKNLSRDTRGVQLANDTH